MWDQGSEKFRSLKDFEVCGILEKEMLCKFGSLKDFEVCGILEKELLCNGQKAINSFGTAICLK
jgi:hypothetical protein